MECPCCEHLFSQFAPFGRARRLHAQCPRCGALERHRLLMILLRRRTNLFTDCLRVLHVAPEPGLKAQLSRLPSLEYVTADLHAPGVMREMDVQKIPFPDGSFDVILCNHVLEHVTDDHLAMRELYRVCAPGGWAIIQVPIHPSRGHTFEDPSVTSPSERRRLFGQHDHVRAYGHDYPDRLRTAGWQVEVVDALQDLDSTFIQRHGLRSTFDRHIVFCFRLNVDHQSG